MSITKASRFNTVQPFVRVTERDDSRHFGLAIGIVTYGDDDTYKVSYLELGARCDHIGADSKSGIKMTDRLDYDDDLMRPDPVKEAVVADRAARADTSVSTEPVPVTD